MDFILVQLIRLGMVIVGLGLSLLTFRHLVLRRFLFPTCAVNDDTCLRVKVWTHENSALALIEPQRFYLWYNGFDFFVYSDQIESYDCGKIGVERAVPAFKLSRVTGHAESIACVDQLADVKNFYFKSKPTIVYARMLGVQLNVNSQTNTVTYSHPQPLSVSARTVANLLLERQIISLGQY